MIVKLVTALGSVADGATVLVENSTARGWAGHKGLVQVEKGDQTVKLQGRLDPSSAWADLVADLAAGITEVNLCPWMRIVCSVWTSGSCSAWLQVDRL